MSPWEWRDFQIIEEASNPAGTWWDDVQQFADYLRGSGIRPKETPLFAKIRSWLDRNGDGRLDERELDIALKDRLLSSLIGGLIVRHRSAWDVPDWKERFGAIDELIEKLGNHEDSVRYRAAEKERVRKLDWWSYVAGQSPGFPVDSDVYHFHPTALAGAFSSPDLITLEMLQAVHPRKDSSYYEDILPILNEYANAYLVNTPMRIAHFLSQVGHESGFVVKSEGGDYSALRMREVFGCKGGIRNYEKNRDECRIGRLREKLWTNESTYAHNAEALLSYVYASRMGNGDEASGDGYKYRGRGIIQLTGRDNYRRYTSIHNSKVPTDPRDFVADPDLIVSELTYGIESAFVYWEMVNANSISDRDDINAVSIAVNGGLIGIEGRQACLQSVKRMLGI